MKKCCIFLKLLKIQDGCTGLPLNHLNGFLMGHKPKFGILFLKGTQLLKFCIIGRHISNEIVKPYSELFTVSRIMWCPTHYFVQQSYHALLCIALFIKKKNRFLISDLNQTMICNINKSVINSSAHITKLTALVCTLSLSFL